MATSLAYGTITISDLADGAQIWTTNQTPTTSNNQYIFTISQLTGDENADVKVGDLIFSSEYRYTIISVGNTTVTTDYRTSLKGIQGEQGYSLRGSYIRDKWTNTQWTRTYGVIGYTASFSNYDILSSGNQTNGKYAITSWSVGDIFFLTGTATDTGIAYTATYTVKSKPTSNTGTVSSSCIAFAHAEKGATGATGNGILSKTDYYMLADTMDSTALDTAKAHFPQDVSGPIVSISDAMGGIPFENVTVNIVPVQSGSGDPSPSNICPITGWTRATVTRTGNNLLEPKVFTSGTGFTNPVKVDFSKYPSYTFSCNISTDICRTMIYGYSSKSDALGDVNKIARTAGTTENVRTISRDLFTYEVTGDVDSIKYIAVRFYGSSTTAQDLNNGEMQVEIGSAATAFEPYNGASYPVTWSEAGTVYGGTLDVVRGKLTVTMAMVDLGALTWSYVPNSKFNFRASQLIGANPPATATVKPNAVCSILPVLDYTTISGAEVDGITIIFATSAQAGKVWAYSGTYTDATTFKSAVTGQTLVYELAEPVTYQLTPVEIESLAGVNNVWADTGDISLTYYNEIDAAWQTTLPEANKYARYLWWYYRTIYTNGDQIDSEPAVIGIYNDDWSDDAIKAQQMAQQALTSANGKNKVYHQATEPSGGTYIEGDTWFDSDDGYKMYTWNGSSWIAEQLGENALADLSITNAKIANGTIDNAKIATLDAGKITTGTLDAQRIAANSLTLGMLSSSIQTSLINPVEYIVGTQTGGTRYWTGVTRESSLTAGKMIAYKLPYAGTSSAAYLELTLTTGQATSTTTGRIGIYRNNSTVTNQFAAGSVINMTYDGTYWRVTGMGSDTTTNYYDRQNYKAALYASEAIAATRIAVLGTDGKLKILANSSFDMTGPILYVATAYSATDVSTPTARTTNYSFWGTAFDLSSTHAIVGAAAGKPVYIVGTMQGTTFTPNSSVLTCTIPNQENDLYYIKLGLMSTATTAVLESQHPLYAYYNGAFQRVDYGAQTKATEVNRTAENALNNAQDAQDAADNALAAASANTSRIKTNESKIETLEGSTGTLSSAVAALNEIIGSNDNQGLRKRQKEADELLTLLQAEIGAFNSWLEFKANSENPNDKTGLIIGKTGESGVYVVQIEGDAISFYENREAARTNDTERRVAFFQNHYLYVDNAKAGGNMEIGNFRFITQANGNMSLVYIGGSE